MKKAIVLAAILAAACSSTGADGPPAAQGAAIPDAASELGPDTVVEAQAPRVQFFVNPRPQDGPSAEVEAVTARYGDPIRVVVGGLAPSETVVLETRGNGASSSASFVAAVDGTVDLGRDAPVAGGWNEADQDAFIWSMVEGTPPEKLDLSLTVRVLREGAEVASGVLNRRYVNEGIVYEKVQEGRTIGAFCAPQNATGPLPAVLVFGGSEGGTSTGVFSCAHLAQLGYAALGVGYFGAAGLPSNLVQVPLEILGEDLAWLAKDPRVDPKRMAVMGGSRGGELALLVGAHYPQVKAIIATVPSGVVFGGLVYPAQAAWTLEGNDIPFLGYHGGLPQYVEEDGVTYEDDTPATLHDLDAAPAAELDAATIAVEAIAGPVLLLAGEDDRLWPSCVLAKVAYDRLVSTGHAATHGDESECYPGAGHAMASEPGWSTMGSRGTCALGSCYLLGGTPSGNARAQRAADTATRRFLEKKL